MSKQEYARQLRYARSKFRRIHSLDLIPEDPSQEESSDDFVTPSTSPSTSPSLSRSNSRLNMKMIAQESRMSVARRAKNFVLFWPNLFVHMLLRIVRYILYIPLSIAAPSFWLSALLWIFWKILRIPVGLFKFILSSDSAAAEGDNLQNYGPQRTVLISCGSTIQTLHLARNFHSSGARVVVFEFDGLFGLARFSTAVDKFYVVPRPTPNNVNSYLAALCHIVRKEKPTVYVPVCATSPAYYDSVVKPHLELLGCATFMTGIQETIILDDCLQLYQRCALQNISLPPYVAISSAYELCELYEQGFISQFRNILLAVGMQGILERYKYMLPRQRRDLKFAHEISDRHQWLVVRDVPGEHYVTCTTVKSSQVVANVSCRVEQDTKNLVPVIVNGSSANNDAVMIDLWLKTFFAKVRFQRPINCHISFRLIKCLATGEFLPLGIRLGVSLPYICYSRSHAQILCRNMKCIHMRPLSLLPQADEESVSESLTSTSIWSTLERSSDATAALDKREALFDFTDPLPYCAYYHFRLPLNSVKTFLQKRYRKANHKAISPRLTVPVD